MNAFLIWIVVAILLGVIGFALERWLSPPIEDYFTSREQSLFDSINAEKNQTTDEADETDSTNFPAA